VDLVEVLEVLEVMEVRMPSIATRLTQSKVRTVHYALQWRLLLSSDQHGSAFDGVINIWDAIFLRRNQLDQFFVDLIIEYLIHVLLFGDARLVDHTSNSEMYDVRHRDDIK
jgi:hypothetical protein